ncbi:Ankyrin-3 [Colletotrichum siamense]|uniref:Ankyrin-3 n=1 Tax=Colletotrichum siamense TaxID=690259 RepID=UPI001872D05A|nr:Ankyrin-3 [Colletotrichum siamense]KAF5510909.1 Ankyrin-3 [Colletotrichum siamense]
MAPGNLMTLNSSDFYTIAWIAALPIERAAAEAMLDEEHGRPEGFSQHPNDTNAYTWGCIGEHNIVIASLPAGAYGLGAAATTASSLSSSLPAIRIGLLVGIGGGIARPDEDHDIRLGDVVVSQPDGTTGGVCQYDLVKAKPGNSRERKGFLAPPPSVLLHAIASIQAAHERKDSEISHFVQDMLKANPKMSKKSKKSPGYIHQGFENDRLFPSYYDHVTGLDCLSCETAVEVKRERRESTDPEIHYGIIASGNTLVKEAITRDQIIADVGEDCICFEMEAAGLMNHFPCLVIRGICDYADSHKNDRWQRYASATAAAYAKELLAYVPPGEIQEAKSVVEILESVNEKISTTQQTAQCVKAKVETLMLSSHAQKIRQWLSAPDPKTNANHARELRHDGTGAWLLESTAFKNWYAGNDRHLWLRGIPGCGKTVLSTRVLDHLAKDIDRIILSFFFDFSDTIKQTKHGLLRSLAFQLYHGGHDSEGHLDNSFREHKVGDEKPTTTTLEGVVGVMLAAQSKVAIVLDALDESTERGEIVSWLEAVFSNTKLEHVQIIYTSREEVEFTRRIPELIGDKCCLSLDGAAIDTDIRSYAMARLQSDHEFTRKRLSESLLGRIHNKVGNGANGMFRWAACQLDRLAKCLSPKEIVTALDGLPETLEETYSRLIQSIPQNYWQSALLLLQFIVYAERPMTLKEAVEIVATNVEDQRPHFDVSCRVFDDNDILSHCPSLVSVIDVHDDGDVTQELHLAHFSVKEYLLLREDFHHMNASIAITTSCLVYLRDIEGHRWRLKKDFPLATYAAQCLMNFAAVAEVSENVATLIVTFLQSEKTFQRWNFLYEADLEWVSYLDIPKGSRLYYACIAGLLKVATSMINAGLDVNAQQGGIHGNPLQAASYHGHLDIVQLLLDNEADVNAQGGKCGNALQAASLNGHLGIVELLLDKNASMDSQSGTHGNALQAASCGGHLQIVQLLLENDADVAARGGCYGNALHAASANGHSDIVGLLLSKHTSSNVQGRIYDDALTAAVRQGHIRIVEKLLESNADPSTPASYNEMAIEVACSNGHFNIAQLLLEGVHDLEPQNGFYTGALRAACARGRQDMVQLLFDKSADIYAHENIIGSLLQSASIGGNENIVKILVNLGVDVNATCDPYGCALQAACWHGREEVVMMLLDHGADVNAPGGYYDSPLHASIINGNENIINNLKRFGANVSVVAENYSKILAEACEYGKAHVVKCLSEIGADIGHDRKIDEYLQTACFFGHSEIVKSLVGVGANVNAQGGLYGSALQAACQNDNKEIIELLVELGADINNGSDFGSALHNAACYGNESLIEMLIDLLGADVNARGSGSVGATNALLAASYVGHSNVVRILLDKGAEVSPRDEDGRTPLFAAALGGHVEVAALLIEAKADINSNAYDVAWTPIIAASFNGHVDVVELLLENGANILDTDS